MAINAAFSIRRRRSPRLRRSAKGIALLRPPPKQNSKVRVQQRALAEVTADLKVEAVVAKEKAARVKRNPQDSVGPAVNRRRNTLTASSARSQKSRQRRRRQGPLTELLKPAAGR